MTRGAASSLNVTGQGAVSDATSQAALLTHQRGLVSDVARQFSWQLCNARLNDDLTREEYRDALLSLQREILGVLRYMAIEDNGAALNLSPFGVTTVQAPAPTLPDQPAGDP